jgi:hypothetical protein
LKVKAALVDFCAVYVFGGCYYYLQQCLPFQTLGEPTNDRASGPEHAHLSVCNQKDLLCELAEEEQNVL